MITQERLQALAQQYQMSVFPNVVREYFQHVFLAQLYKWPESNNLMFKGGTALRIIYGSPRFSEDLDFSLFKVEHHRVKTFVEGLFVKVLADIEQVGVHVEIDEKSGPTDGGYFGIASFQATDHRPINVEINVSTRNGRILEGEIDSVANDFVSTYNIIHLPQNELVEEKVFGALLQRKKPRDYYDLYFIMRRGMLNADQKKRLASVKTTIVTEARAIDFRTELGAFLPVDQQSIIRNFGQTLAAEMDRQLAPLS